MTSVEWRETDMYFRHVLFDNGMCLQRLFISICHTCIEYDMWEAGTCTCVNVLAACDDVMCWQLLNLWSDQAAVAGLFLGCSMLTFVSSKLDVIRPPLHLYVWPAPFSLPSCSPYSMTICCLQSMRKLDSTLNGFCKFLICSEQAYPYAFIS